MWSTLWSLNETAVLSLNYFVPWEFVCLFTTCGGLDSSPVRWKIDTVLSNAPDVLCFACPCLLAYFREATNLCCAHEASPYFLLEGGPCLPGLPAQNICYQATVRPVPLRSGVVYTPSGSISQQHCITLTGFPNSLREIWSAFSLQPTKMSHTLIPQLFSQPLNNFLPSLSAVSCSPRHSEQQNWNRGEDCLWKSYAWHDFRLSL